ncbi:1,4-alpha-glucan branching enzyme, partial [Monoraphidium neglectum]
MWKFSLAAIRAALYDVDPDLRRFKDHLDYRWSRYQAARQEILGSGFESIADFAKGYEQLGFTRQGGATVYREWAPAATAAALIGDFSGWQPVWMEKGEFGVWSVTLPDGPDGPAIPHGSRVKVRLQTFQGWWADRVPAWIKYATIPAGEMGAKYNGVYWDPPKGEKHEWVHPRPAKPRGLRIYEAHVGMGGEAEKVSTYREFIEAVLPRIKAQGYNAIQLMAIQEHAYYASFGYHVTNPFAVSSRSGTPEDLK